MNTAALNDTPAAHSGELGRAQVSSPNGDRGRNVSPPAGGQIRSYTFGPFAAEAMLRERKAMKVVKDMDGKGL